MTTLRRNARALAALVASTALASCVYGKQVSPLPLQTAFTADLPFTVESSPAAIIQGDIPVHCRVRRVVVRLLEVRSDTVFFSGVVSHLAARGEPRCLLAGPGIIALGGQAQVRSEIVRSDSVQTLFAVLAVVPAVFGLWFVLRRMGG
jgi:hypothetical protein